MTLKELSRRLLTTSLSNRAIADTADVAPNTVRRYRARLLEEGLTWGDVSLLTEAELEARLNGGRKLARKSFIEPDFQYVHTELRKIGVTLLMLHEEYGEQAGEAAMSETEFRRRYHRHQRSLGIVMRQPHTPGYRLFLDYSGKRPCLVDPVTGEKTPVELFVAVMGSCRKTFMYATESQRLPDWCEANIRALEFFGGVPTLLVPDNLKAAVDRVTKAEGHVINFTFSKLAEHYGTIVMPARPKEPTDKAPVEVGVKLAQRWAIGRLRHRTFTSIGELNEALAEMTELMNDKPMKGFGGKSRNQLFEELDRPALKPLPEKPFEYADWKLNVTVPQDYHVAWDGHFYSVPFRYVGAKVRLRITARMVEVYHKHENFPVASHLLCREPGGCTTLREHQPAAHQAYAADQGAEMISWAEKSGESISAFVRSHIDKHRRPALSMQALKGLRTLEREYGLARLDAACKRAVAIPNITITSVRSMLQRGIEDKPLRGRTSSAPTSSHGNVRGAQAYE